MEQYFRGVLQLPRLCVMVASLVRCASGGLQLHMCGILLIGRSVEIQEDDSEKVSIPHKILKAD